MNLVKKHFIITLVDTAEEEVVIKAYKKKRIKGETWIGLPRGRPKIVRACLKNDRVWKQLVDKRTSAPVEIPLKFNGSFEGREYQPKAMKKLAKTENGVLKSAPRTGKCMTGDAILATNYGLLPIADMQCGPLIRAEGNERWYSPPHGNVFVASMDGYKVVRAIYHSEAEVFQVNTSSGRSITVTAGERFWVDGQWKLLEDLQVGDELRVQDTSTWRKTEMRFSSFPEEYTKRFDRRLTPALATLIAYRSRMVLVSQDDKTATVQISGSPSCVKYAGILLARFGGEADGKTLRIPLYLWSMLERYYFKDMMPRVVMLSRKSIVKTYLQSLFEINAFQRITQQNTDGVDLGGHTTYCLDWDLGFESLARQVQTVLDNFGIWVMRDGSRLYADPANTRNFFETLEIKGISEFGDNGVPPKPNRTKVTSIVPQGVKPVYDLSVGDAEDEGQHHFVANGIVVHNTVMGTGAIIKVQQKTLILAHQTDLIEQFANETINDKSGNLFNGASLKEPVAKICKTYEDFVKYPICLCTYQMFLSKKGKKLLKKIKDMFGVLLIDEVHRTPADRYSAIIAQFSAKHVWGLTATDDRKDGKYELACLIVGDVTYRVKAEAMAAKVYGRETGVKHYKPPSTWNGAISFLFKNEARNIHIVRTALRDVAKGHVVLIPIMHKEHAVTLKKLFVLLSGEKDMVFTFTGDIPKAKRQWARDEMNNNKKIKVVIAMRSMLTGMNIPRWSAIYTVAPISNEPNYEQEIKRVCTPMEGKQTPIIRYFFDGVLGLSHGCLRTCAKTLLNPENRFEISPTFRQLLGQSASAAKRPEGRAIDDLDIVRAAHGERKPMRF